MPVTPALQGQTTPMKRSASAGLAALMPFALVKVGTKTLTGRPSSCSMDAVAKPAGAPACRLTAPESCLQEYPSQESMSLADANRRIQAFAEADSAACTPQSSNSSSGLLGPAALRSGARPRILVDRIHASGDDLVSQGSFL